MQTYKPYLIQRLTLADLDPATPIDSLRFGELFDMDYMGAAEFEFGAFPKNIRRVHEQCDTMVPFTFELDGVKYYGFYDSEMFELSDVVYKCKRLGTPAIFLKEGARFPWKKRSEVVAWMDIENGVFLSIYDLSSVYMTLIGNTVKYLDAKKAISS